ncbi:MAG TPA: DUF6268 family outer membrane beta-barrel protein [Verrucomicrobiae bacterium]
MRIKHTVLAAMVFFGTTSALIAAPETEIRHQFSTGFSYSAPADLNIGDVNAGEMDAFHTDLSYLLRFPTSDSYAWGVGFGWERSGFGLPAGVPLPNTVNALTLNFQNDWKFADKWNLRIDVRPGLFSDLEDIDGGDVNVPLTVGVSYQQSATLMWVAALNVDYLRDIPVIGGVGVRWQFAQDWTLSLILPKPALEYQLNPQTTLFAGAELMGGAYRVAEDFGDRTGRPNLNDEIVSYREIRVGGGVRARLGKGFSVAAEAGWVVDRRFVFEDADLQLNGDGALYFGLTLNARF